LLFFVLVVGWERRTGAFIDPYSTEDRRSQWPRGVRCGSVAARLLGLEI